MVPTFVNVIVNEIDSRRMLACRPGFERLACFVRVAPITMRPVTTRPTRSPLAT